MPAITGYILLLFPADTDGTWCNIRCLNPAYTISTLGVVPAAPSDTCLFMVLPTAAGTVFTFWSLPAVIRCTWSNFMALYPAGTMCALCLVPAAPPDTSLPILLPRAAVAVSTFLSFLAATSCAWSDVIWFHPAGTMCALSLVPAAPVNTCLFMVLLQRLVQSLHFCLSRPLPLVHDQIFLASPRPIPCMHYALSRPPL